MVDPKHDTYRVIWSEDDGEFVGLCAEFPSLSHLDQSQAEALPGITQLVADTVSDMQVSGETPPQPIADRQYSGHFQVRVTADPPLGRLLIEVDYRVRATNTFYNLVYPFYLTEGEQA